MTKKMKLTAALGLSALVAGGGILAFHASPSVAAVQVGARAPDFTLNAAKGGKSYRLNLAQELRKGPVVLYFFPAAFTPGCTVEANLFAEASDDFQKLGAQVIGVTAGNIERVAEFSRSECRDKFAVAADPNAAVAQRYEAAMQMAGRPMLSNRTSFVIAPDGRILLRYTERKPQDHVSQTMAAVRAWKAQQR